MWIIHDKKTWIVDIWIIVYYLLVYPDLGTIIIHWAYINTQSRSLLLLKVKGKVCDVVNRIVNQPQYDYTWAV
jgi:hypothetical protein